MSGIKADIEVQLIPQGNNVYKAVYVPEQPGKYKNSLFAYYLLRKKKQTQCTLAEF